VSGQAQTLTSKKKRKPGVPEELAQECAEEIRQTARSEPGNAFGEFRGWARDLDSRRIVFSTNEIQGINGVLSWGSLNDGGKGTSCNATRRCWSKCSGWVAHEIE